MLIIPAKICLQKGARCVIILEQWRETQVNIKKTELEIAQELKMGLISSIEQINKTHNLAASRKDSNIWIVRISCLGNITRIILAYKDVKTPQYSDFKRQLDIEIGTSGAKLLTLLLADEFILKKKAQVALISKQSDTAFSSMNFTVAFEKQSKLGNLCVHVEGEEEAINDINAEIIDILERTDNKSDIVLTYENEYNWYRMPLYEHMEAKKTLPGGPTLDDAVMMSLVKPAELNHAIQKVKKARYKI